MQNSNQKIKLLVLYQLLKTETDEDHPMSTPAICKAMQEKGTPCDRRTLPKDIELLNSMGFEVMSISSHHTNSYYVPEREFSIPELKILIDAVQAAGFIPRKKSDELIGKLTGLASRSEAEQLKRNMLFYNNRKHTNDQVYYTIDHLERAIREHKQVSFLYFDLDEKGRRVYRKSGKRYVADPIALIYNEDFYYLVTYNQKYDVPTNYRIDRMASIAIEDTPVSEKAILREDDFSSYTEQAFKMYGGEKSEVKLRFHKSVLGAVFDKFGEKIPVEQVSEDEYEAVVTVQVSPTFFGWVFQFGEKMTILSPGSVKEQYLSRFAKAAAAQKGAQNG